MNDFSYYFSNHWRARLLLGSYPHVFMSAMRSHIATLKLISTKKPKVCEVLNGSHYWQSLLKQQSDKKEVKKWQAYWQKLQFLPHLNAKELIFLLNNTLRPFEKHLEQMVTAFEETNRFTLFMQTKQSLLQEAQQNLNRVKKLKSKLYDALLVRCAVNKTFRVSYKHDDALGQLCLQLNRLQKKSEEHLLVETKPSTLDDDTRIMIYDILLNTGFNENAVYSVVMDPVRKKSIKSFSTKEKVHQNLKATAQFIHAVLDTLKAENSYRKLFSYQLTFPDLGFVGDFFNIKAFPIIYQFRYFFIIAAFYIAYGLLMQFITPILLVTVSSSILHSINSLLFYTVGIAPLWYWGFNHANKLIQGIGSFILNNEHQCMVNALIGLEQAEFFMANRLSQPIVDLACFDFAQLRQDAQRHHNTLKTTALSLNETRGWKKWLFTLQYKAQVDAISKKINEQQARLDKQLELLAKHLAAEIGQELTLLSESPDNHQLMAHLPQDQLLNCRNFVNEFSNTKTKQQFAENTDVIGLWVNKIGVNHLGHQIQTQSKTKIAWGGYHIRQDALNGWANILNSFVENEQQRRACQEVNDLLRGKHDISLDKLCKILKIISKTHAPLLLKNMQWFIFNTLTERNKTHATLLSATQKGDIVKWFMKHKTEILKAQRVISAIFQQSSSQLDNKMDKIDDETLTRYYELLDEADLYYHASAQTESIQITVNAARKFFESYQGADATAYRFIKFVPKKEKTAIVSEIAEKRLNWILSHLATMPNRHYFTPIDTELFHNYRLLSEECRFDFDTVILESEQFNQTYNVSMERFLIECQQHGFGGSPLLENYLARHQTTRAILLHPQDKTEKLCQKTALKTIALR